MFRAGSLLMDFALMQTLQSLDNRLKGRRTGKRLYYRAPPAAEAQAGAIIVPGPEWLGSDEVIITVGVLRYGQLSCLQVWSFANSHSKAFT